jgi:hypothetical protein
MEAIDETRAGRPSPLAPLWNGNGGKGKTLVMLTAARSPVFFNGVTTSKYFSLVHDLLLLNSWRVVPTGKNEPRRARAALEHCPWVVVRREHSDVGASLLEFAASAASSAGLDWSV